MVIGGTKFNNDEILAIIMNMAIDKKLGEVSYSELLKMNQREMSKTLWENIDEMQPVINPITLDLLMRRGQAIAKLKEDVLAYGVPKEILEEKDIRNIYTAKQIVDNYVFDKELDTKEKGIIIQVLLKNTCLNTSGKCYLAKVLEYLEREGYTEQERYGILINSAILSGNGNEIGYSYETILTNPNKLLEYLRKGNGKFPINVGNTAMVLAKMKTLTEQDENQIKQELLNLGIPQELIDTRDIKNLFVAKQIVEGYHFQKPLEPKEIGVLIRTLLMNISLDKSRKGNENLAKTLGIMLKEGLVDQEIYGTLLNMAIGSSWKEIGYTYGNVIRNRDILLEVLEKYEGRLPTKISDITLLVANMNLLTEQEGERLREEAITLGIEKEFIDKKDIRNIYIAKQIVDGYTFERELEAKEKGILMKNLLRSNLLNRTPSLARTLEVLEREGFDTQEAYGILINLAIKGNGKEVEYDYEKVLASNSKLVDVLKTYKGKLQSKVSDLSILIVKMNALTKQDEEDIKNELLALDIPASWIESRDVKNMYMAKQIIDGYDFQISLSPQNKKDLYMMILGTTTLTKNYYGNLSILMKNLELSGFTEQEIYGMIMNLGINENIVEYSGYGYNDLLLKTYKVKDLPKYKGKIRTKITTGDLIKAHSMNLSEEEIEELRTEYEKLGISREFLEIKDIRNLYTAMEIVNRYNFAEAISDTQKRGLLQCILSNSVLNKGNNGKLMELFKELEEIGLTEQEVCGAIINLGVNKHVVPYTGYGYQKLLNSRKEAIKMVEYKDEMDTKVDKFTIQLAEIDSLSSEEIKRLKQECEDLGISKALIDQKDINNLYMAKKICEQYHFEEKLSREEESAIIQSILGNSLLDDNTPRILLLSLIKKLNRIGLTEQEIYGTIINLAIKGKVIEEKGYGYQDLLTKSNRVLALAQYKEKIDSRVDPLTVSQAKVNYLSQDEMNAIKNIYEDYGISREFIEKKDDRNLYLAYQMVNGYKPEDKRGILYALLTPSALDKGKVQILKLVQSLCQIGLTPKQAYGAITNLAINGRIISKGGYNYSSILLSSKKVLELSPYIGEIETDVTAETIEKAKTKPRKIMKNAVKKLKKDGNLDDIKKTMEQLKTMSIEQQEEQDEKSGVDR